MRGGRLCLAFVIVASAAAAPLAQQPPAAPTPPRPGATAPAAAESAPALAQQVGDVAPDFALPGSDGKTYRLADFKGVKPVVLAWFPKGPIRE